MQSVAKRRKCVRSARFTQCVAVALLTPALLIACDQKGDKVDAGSAADNDVTASAPESPPRTDAGGHLDKVLAAQPPEVRARYAARNPRATLEFFGVAPGMTVVEADPGAGWYSGILRAFLGENGRLIGADYPMQVYRLFNYYSEEELTARASWTQRWPREISAGAPPGAAVSAYALGGLPGELEGRVDVFLLIRALHNLADFEEEGGFLSTTLDEVYRALKPGGTVGVVQHQGPESHSDAWASGANGYLKKSFVIDAMEKAGFVFEAESPVNENPDDRPAETESVWRLAPTLEAPDDPDQAAAYAAIGESNRMTLRFRKPGP